MSSAPAKFEWLVILPDQPGALERRLKVRPDHLANVLADNKAGDDLWVLGGAFMSEVPKPGETPDMLGSAMVAVAATKEEVLERLKKDVYTTGEVWDWEKVQIWPFKSAVRKGL
ncbi:hypothetical protein K402DRAFT_400582 [Aulographum hederae CBS 113979]|uniref:YCII-related domain-containing protein n=1 Tax=Aulographum hederae CBS 113979 TaxID=1176131 RepID=A0A6G1HCZ0_9PEZI|nr:hypothetical protein K402DRAFT_400582 [Aulographum hederae CBS 113979]